jgi:NADPH:quinone reductase-like Zn-dependent oxidoreductase
MMRAIVAKGPPGGVKVALRPVPKASPGNLLVRVRAAACQDDRFSQFVFTANLRYF